jgi:hypothetical protein
VILEKTIDGGGRALFIRVEFPSEPVGKNYRDVCIRRSLDFCARLRGGRGWSGILVRHWGSLGCIRDYLESGGAAVFAIKGDRTRALAIPIALCETQLHAIRLCAQDFRAKANASFVRLNVHHPGLFKISQTALAGSFVERVQILLQGVDLFLS